MNTKKLKKQAENIGIFDPVYILELPDVATKEEVKEALVMDQSLMKSQMDDTVSCFDILIDLAVFDLI